MSQPRVVIVHRADEVAMLRQNYGTFNNANYLASSRSAAGGALVARAAKSSAIYESALEQVAGAIPDEWRRARVLREELDRFLFEPNDIVAVVGRDGLVANVAKYLDRQVVIGFNDNPQQNVGILVRNPPRAASQLFAQAAEQRDVETRTMVEVELDDGQKLCALNEVFLGHTSHQSARYQINLQVAQRAVQAPERQSSSGIIVSTGTGASGWARSIALTRSQELKLDPTEPQLRFFVREPWPMAPFGATIQYGTISDQDESLVIISEIEEGGTIFGDGMEIDHLDFRYGRVARVHVAQRKLRLL